MAKRSANRSEGHHVQHPTLRSPPAPAAEAASWATDPSLVGSPPAQAQEVLLVLSQILAKGLPAAVQKEAKHEHS